MADLVAELLHADPEEQRRLLAAAPRSDLESAIATLGRQRSVEAATTLALMDRVLTDKGLRKAARRERHRLESAGIRPRALTEAPAPVQPPPAQPTVPVTEAWATRIQGDGSRLLWLLGEPPLGGAWIADFVLSDVDGVVDMLLVDSTRKRFHRDLEEMRRERGVAWVPLPPDYAMRLVREAVDQRRAAGGALPPSYVRFRELFGEAEGPPERALIYDTVSAVEARFHPEWVAQGERLLDEPELLGWAILPGPELAARAKKVVRAEHSPLLVPGQEPDEQARTLLADALRTLLTPERRRMLRRRFEETAFVFAQTDRLRQAQWAVAAAVSLEDPTAPLHPLVPWMVAIGLVVSLGRGTPEQRDQAEELMALFEEVLKEGPEAIQGPATAPSGLILPR